MNQNCPKCGNPLQIGTIVCPICGTVVGEQINQGVVNPLPTTPIFQNTTPVVNEPTIGQYQNNPIPATPVATTPIIQDIQPQNISSPSVTNPLYSQNIVPEQIVQPISQPTIQPVTATPVTQTVEPVYNNPLNEQVVPNPSSVNINSIYPQPEQTNIFPTTPTTSQPTNETLLYPNVEPVTQPQPTNNLFTEQPSQTIQPNSIVNETISPQEPVVSDLNNNFQTIEPAPIEPIAQPEPPVQAEQIFNSEPIQNSEIIMNEPPQSEPIMQTSPEQLQTIEPQIEPQPVIENIQQPIQEPIVQTPTIQPAPTPTPVVNPETIVAPQPVEQPLVGQKLELNGVTPEQKTKKSFKINKKALVAVAVLLVVFASSFTIGKVMMNKKDSLDSMNAVKEPSKVAKEVNSSGYKFEIDDSWYIEEDGSSVIISNAADSIYINLFHMNTTFDSVTDTNLENYFVENGSYSNIKIDVITLGTKSAKYVSANVLQGGENKLPVEYYYINGGSTLMVGATVIYKTEEAQKNFRSSVTDILSTLSYSDDSAKVLEKRNSYNSIFSAGTRVYNIYGVEIIPMN